MVYLAFLLKTKAFSVLFLASTCFPVDDKLVLYVPGPSISVTLFYFSGLLGYILTLFFVLYFEVRQSPFESIFYTSSLYLRNYRCLDLGQGW